MTPEERAPHFSRAMHDVEEIVERLGWADPMVVVQHCWQRYEQMLKAEGHQEATDVAA